jgi:hypothetical protein
MLSEAPTYKFKSVEKVSWFEDNSTCPATQDLGQKISIFRRFLSAATEKMMRKTINIFNFIPVF